MLKNIIPLIHDQNPDAIAILYDAYAGAVFGVIMRIVLNRELAEQVMQDTFLKVWRNGPQYNETRGTLFTWLISIARNAAIDATRNCYYRNSQITDNLDQLIETSGGQSIKLDTIGLNDEVQKLSAKHKVLIELIYLKGYTHKEAAEMTGIPLGTVKTRIRSAIVNLRKLYDTEIEDQ